jgi:hypothetical protein
MLDEVLITAATIFSCWKVKDVVAYVHVVVLIMLFSAWVNNINRRVKSIDRVDCLSLCVMYLKLAYRIELVPFFPFLELLFLERMQVWVLDELSFENPKTHLFWIVQYALFVQTVNDIQNSMILYAHKF